MGLGLTMYLSDTERGTHVYVIGATGSGKSRALETWIQQDAQAGRGLGVIDPAGDLFANTLARLAILSLERPGLRERVVIVDPLDLTWTVAFNPLEVLPGEVPERKAGLLADAVTKIWQADPLVVTRMRRLMRYAFLSLMSLGLTLLELPRFLSDREYRRSLLPSLKDPKLSRYWQGEFPQSVSQQQLWMQSTLNRVGDFVDDPDLRLIVGQQGSTLDFRQIMDEGLVLLVNIPKGALGWNGYLLGAFIVAQIQQAALSRANISLNKRRPFYLYLDEFQNYITEDIHTILAESRKYGLSLILAHQYLGQLRSGELRSAILNTVGNIVCFKVGEEDARALAPLIFAPDINAVKEERLRWQNLGSIPIPIHERVYRPLPEVKEALLRRLIDQEPRCFWYKQRGSRPAVHARTQDAPDPVLSAEAQEALWELWNTSGRRYGRLKAEVARELAHREQPVVTKRRGDKVRVEEVQYELDWPPQRPS